MNLLEHFVGGKLISGSSDRKSKIFNPATGEQESEVRLASKVRSRPGCRSSAKSI